jgi:acyl-[acyl-carrier-protein]-phospholipid O-acyltransferase/long-chain-fatty-acid--[acyl-carrier-protein] ligase
MAPNTKWLPLFTTNFLGVFNNNFFKTLIILLGIKWFSANESSLITSLASGLYVVSYIFFSPYAGKLAKTKHKKKIIVVSRMIEFSLFVIGSFGFYIQNIYVVMTCIFLLGLISTLFSPAKYGLIRDIGGNEGISFGTGTLEMLTFFGALLGPLLAAIISDHYNFYLMAGIFIVVSISGWFSISRLKVVETEPMKECNDTVNPIKFFIESVKFAGKIKGLNLIVAGLASFWMIASFIQLTILEHCPKVLKMTNTEMGYVLTASAVGIGLGSYLAGIISKGKIELGLTPIGGIGMTITMLLLFFLQPTGIVFTGLILLTAMFCGIFMVPLSASVQSSVEGRKQGDMIAYSNFVIFLLIFISAAVFGFISKAFGSNTIFILLVIIVSVMTSFMLFKVPDMSQRFKKLIGIK